jgi:hypothetical protein
MSSRGADPADLEVLQSVKDGSAEYAAFCRQESLNGRQKVMELFALIGRQPPSAGDAGMENDTALGQVAPPAKLADV